MKDLEKQKNDNDERSGTIELDDKFIIFKSQGAEIYKFLLGDIKIIGEMTTQADAFANDWNIIFIGKDGTQYYVPAYANNMDDFLKELGTKLNTTIIGSLSWSVDFNSNVIFPENLAGQKLLDFTDDEPKNIWEKFLKFMGFGKPITSDLTNEIKSYLNF